MLLTSSRKPSFKTKILCKKLALFCDAAYMTRGKMSMSEVLERGKGSVLVIVGEYHGNPGSLSFYDPAGRMFLSLRFSDTSFDTVSNTELRYGEKIFYGSASSLLFNIMNQFLFEDKGLMLPPDAYIEPRARPSAEGSEKEGDLKAVSCICDKDAPAAKSAVTQAYVRRLYIHDDRLDFYSNDRLFLRLYVKGMKSDLLTH